VLRALHREPFGVSKAEILQLTWYEIVHCYLQPPGEERGPRGKYRTPGVSGNVGGGVGLAGYKAQWDWAKKHQTVADPLTGKARPYTQAELAAMWAKKVEDLTRRRKFGLGGRRPVEIITRAELRRRRAEARAKKGAARG
jgi:hypothetical protein